MYLPSDPLTKAPGSSIYLPAWGVCLLNSSCPNLSLDFCSMSALPTAFPISGELNSICSGQSPQSYLCLLSSFTLHPAGNPLGSAFKIYWKFLSLDTVLWEQKVKYSNFVLIFRCLEIWSSFIQVADWIFTFMWNFTNMSTYIWVSIIIGNFFSLLCFFIF